MRIAMVGLVVALTACTGGGDDDPNPCPGNRVHFYMAGNVVPTFVAVRDGAGAWATPARSADGRFYDLCVDDDYVAVAVCPHEHGAEVFEYAGTVAEGEADVGPCFGTGTGSGGSGETVAITGALAAPGWISVAYFSLLTGTDPWVIHAAPGTYDLIAMSGPNNDPHNIHVEHGVDIAASTDEGTIDADADGAPLAQVPLTVTGALATDRLTTTSDLITAHGWMELVSSREGTAAVLAPPSQLESGDHHQLTVRAGSDRGDGSSTTRTVLEDYTGTETTIALPAVLDGIAFDDAAHGVSWAALPGEYTRLFYSVADLYSQASLAATAGWIAKHAAASLAFDASAPGFDPAWGIDAPTGRSFTHVRITDPANYYSSYSRAVATP